MRTIHKKISLDNFKSHMPSIVPAYDMFGVQHNFSHITDFENQPIVNYNMIPFDVKTPSDESFGAYSDRLFTFRELCEIFHSLDVNFNFNTVEKCKQKQILSNEDLIMYFWLVDKIFPYFIFDKELEGNEKLNDIKKYWQTNKLSIQEVSFWTGKMNDLKSLCEKDSKKYCCECDEFEKRGGDYMLNKLSEWYNLKIKPIICNLYDYGHDFVYDVKESDTKVTVKVLKEDKNNVKTVSYHTFDIYEPRVRVFGNNRYIKYGEITKNGQVKNPQNIEIIDGVLTIPCLNISNKESLIISEPSISIPLTLNCNIQNIGEMTPISENWDSGYEYNASIQSEEELDYDGGAIVYYNDDTWILETYNWPGYIYSSKYKEVYFGNVNGMTYDEYVNYQDNDENDIESSTNNNEQWKRYIDYLPKINGDLLKKYSYKGNKLIINPNPFVMSSEYEIVTNENYGFCLKYNKICQLFECEYFVFNDKPHLIYYVYEKINPYVIIDGKRIWLDFVKSSNNTKVFIKNNKCIEINNLFDVKSGLCFFYNGMLYEKKDGEFIYGYAEVDNVIVHFIKTNNDIKEMVENEHLGKYVKYDELQYQSDNTQRYYTTYTQENKTYLKFSNPYVIYDAKYINGETTSRLSEFIDEINIATDNLGNRFEGLMPYKEIIIDENTKYADYVVNPKPNDWLCIPYIPQMTFDLELEDSEKELYYGNIIKKLTFNYDELVDGDFIHKIKEANNNDDLKDIETNILKNGIINNIISNIMLEVEYYIGTIIKKDGDNTYSLYHKNDGEYYGIKYVDTFRVEHKQCLYHYDEINSCLLNYFKLNPSTKMYINETYGVVKPNEQITYFEYLNKPFALQYGFIYKTSNNDTFYNVKETDENVTINGISYPIVFEGSKKYICIKANDNEMMHEDYTYYCIKDNKKYYAKFDGNKFTMQISSKEVYVTNGLTTPFLIQRVMIKMPYELFYMIPLNLYFVKNDGTLDEHFDYSNGMSLSPLIFNENKLGFATLEKNSENIYIDRGTIRAMDFHLRLLETKSLESLEQIGNGFFKIQSNNDF